MTRRVAVILILVLLSGCGGGVSQEEYDALASELAGVLAANRVLTAQQEALSDEVADLRRRLAANSTSTTEGRTFDLHGSVLVAGSSTVEARMSGVELGEECVAEDGLDDIHEGTQVVVGDGAGATVATGRLESGRIIEIPGTEYGPVVCAFDFGVDDVPENDFYTVTVSNRNELAYSLEELASLDWDLVLSLT